MAYIKRCLSNCRHGDGTCCQYQDVELDHNGKCTDYSPAQMDDVIIYTDGSVSGNGKPTAIGGWATILQAYKPLSVYESRYGSEGLHPELLAEIEKCGRMTYETDNCAVTNNRAEMYAILKGLESITKKCNIKVYSDSELCIKTLNGEFARKTNLDMWKQLDSIISELNQIGCKITFQWVKGHADSELNKRCDKMASKVKRGEISEKS